MRSCFQKIQRSTGSRHRFAGPSPSSPVRRRFPGGKRRRAPDAGRPAKSPRPYPISSNIAVMEDLLAARLQMAVSLGFHIIFAVIGMAMPFLMAVSHFRWLRTGRQVYRDLTVAWSRGVAIFFATGAVSGTALSFELGLLWPEFMLHAGPIFGMPFSWEGTAFFIEAIALGLFLYGWDRLKPWVHWGVGVVVGVSGVLSGIFVVCANAWMNAPAGFDWING